MLPFTTKSIRSRSLQVVTGEMTLGIVEHPAVQEQMTVQEIPQVLERIKKKTEEQVVHVSLIELYKFMLTLEKFAW